MPRPFALLLLPLAAALAGCGSGGGGTPTAPPRPPVRLLLTAPQDSGTTSAATVQVAGTVSPLRSRVLVLGRRVAVSGGRFATAVALREGMNIIDIGASASGAVATWRAVRVTRHSKVGIPALAGLALDNATSDLRALGLRPKIDDQDGFFDAFRAGPRGVCRTDPAAGRQVDPGSQVRVVVSKSC